MLLFIYVMKAYTDTEQSRKLSEILPIESADMWYQHTGWEHIANNSEVPIYFPILKRDSESDVDIPCWTLASLLSILNCPDLTQTSDGGWYIRTWYLNHPYSVGGAENPVDACVEMIIKLHELKML